MRGRRPKPLPKLRLIGTYRQDRHGWSPDPPATKAECPEWLQGSAREHWPAISEMLSNMKLNSAHYTISMALLCDALADFIRFSQLAAGTEDPTTETDKGNVIQHPI